MAIQRKRKSSAKAQAKRDFILAYIEEYGSIEVIDAAFHEAFHQLFGGRRDEKRVGARPVYRAQRLLETMVAEGVLERERVATGFKMPGVPRWMWVYKKKRETFVW